jgi:hypothetical protein
MAISLFHARKHMGLGVGHKMAINDSREDQHIRRRGEGAWEWVEPRNSNFCTAS